MQAMARGTVLASAKTRNGRGAETVERKAQSAMGEGGGAAAANQWAGTAGPVTEAPGAGMTARQWRDQRKDASSWATGTMEKWAS